eukprot:6491877-Amphidinium_carterae.1
MSAVVKYVVTTGAKWSEGPAPETPPSLILRYSLILRRVPLSNLPGCFSASRATLLESLNPPTREPDDDPDDEVEPRRRLRLDLPLDLERFRFSLEAARAVNSC